MGFTVTEQLGHFGCDLIPLVRFADSLALDNCSDVLSVEMNDHRHIGKINGNIFLKVEVAGG